MFLHLSRLAKASLTISHRNAVAERGFSVNAAVLSKDSMSLDETTIQAIRLVKETIRLYGSPTIVAVTRSRLWSMQCVMLTLSTWATLDSKKTESCSRSCMQEGSHTNSWKPWNCKKKTRGRNISASWSGTARKRAVTGARHCPAPYQWSWH